MSDLEPTDPVKPHHHEDRNWIHSSSSSPCSICLEIVLDQGERAIAKLQCGHEFHLDCIGSAFNAKGAMQCPNCRKVEKGRWLFANGHRSSSDFDLEGWVTDEFYDLSYSELPVGIQWCPFRGFTQLTSLFEEGEPQPNSYLENMAHTAFGDHASASNSSQICPYLASLHGFPHPLLATAPSNSTDSIPENNPFHMHPNNLNGVPPSSDMMNPHNFPLHEQQNHNWQQHHSLPFSLANAVDQSTPQFAPRISRSDTSSQQRAGSFVHHLPLMHHVPIARSGSNLMASMGPPVARGHGSNHMYQPPVRSTPFPLMRRPRPRGLTLVSSLAAASASAEADAFYSSIGHQDADEAARHFDRFYGWGGRDGFTSLPWIPLEGESQWWGPFNPNAGPQAGGSFVHRTAGERVPQSRPGPGMPPPYM